MTPAFEGGAQLSADGRWMVYQSNESGQPEIYAHRYPALDRAWRIRKARGDYWTEELKHVLAGGGVR